MTTVSYRATTVTVTIVDAVATTSDQLRGQDSVLGACSDSRRTSFRDGLHPSPRLWRATLRPRRQCRTLPRITPAPVGIAVIAVLAASAPVAEHIAPAPAEIAGPAPVVRYISPAPAVSYAGYAAAALVVEYVSTAPAISHAVPTPVQCASPVTYAAAPAMTVARIDLNRDDCDAQAQYGRPISYGTTTITVPGVDLDRDGTPDVLQQPPFSYATLVQFSTTTMCYAAPAPVQCAAPVANATTPAMTITMVALNRDGIPGVALAALARKCADA